jgi:hypothetical protein
MFFGGYDTKTKTLTNKCEILNIELLSTIDKAITDCSKKDTPSPRAFHSTIKYGPTLLLFGGEKSSTEYYSDIYKFITSSKEWIKLDIDEDENYLKNHGSILLYNYLEGSDSDKPIIVNADNVTHLDFLAVFLVFLAWSSISNYLLLWSYQFYLLLQTWLLLRM